MHLNQAERLGLFITGALLGATIGFLYAPQSGTRTRKQIRRKAQRGVEQLEDLRSDIRARVDDWVEDVTDAVDEGLHRGRRLTLAGKERVLGVFDEAKQCLDQGRERIERLIQTRD